MWPDRLDLKFCLLNAENLFLLFDPQPPEMATVDESQWNRLSTSVYDNKSLRKSRELARCLQQINADVVMLCEIGGLESLRNFNELFLQQEYSPVLIEGNSERNIDVGYLIRRGSPFYFDLLSNKNRPINYLYPHERDSQQAGYPTKVQSHRFSRDVIELRFFQKDREKPFLISLLTHLKSRLDPDRIDPNGFERRQAELKTLLEIYHELQEKFPETPIMVSGDFNGNASANGTDEEFRAIYSGTDLKDVLEWGQIELLQRATYYQIRPSQKADGRQIDYCFMQPQLAKYLVPRTAQVYRYRNHLGLEIDIPQTMDAKTNLPSDHYPIVFEFKQLPGW